MLLAYILLDLLVPTYNKLVGVEKGVYILAWALVIVCSLSDFYLKTRRR